MSFVIIIISNGTLLYVSSSSDHRRWFGIFQESGTQQYFYVSNYLFFLLKPRSAGKLNTQKCKKRCNALIKGSQSLSGSLEIGKHTAGETGPNPPAISENLLEKHREHACFYPQLFGAESRPIGDRIARGSHVS